MFSHFPYRYGYGPPYSPNTKYSYIFFVYYQYFLNKKENNKCVASTTHLIINAMHLSMCVCLSVQRVKAALIQTKCRPAVFSGSCQAQLCFVLHGTSNRTVLVFWLCAKQAPWHMLQDSWPSLNSLHSVQPVYITLKSFSFAFACVCQPCVNQIICTDLLGYDPFSIICNCISDQQHKPEYKSRMVALLSSYYY